MGPRPGFPGWFVRRLGARWRTWIPVVGVVVALVVGLIAVRSATTAVAQPDPGASAPDYLEQAADLVAAAESRPIPAPRPDQWFYERVHERSITLGDEGARERWHKMDNSERVIREPGGSMQQANDGEWPPDRYSAIADTPLELYDLYRSLPDAPEALLGEVYALVDERHLTEHVSLACAKPEDCEAIRTERWVRDYMAFQSIHDLLSAGTPQAELRANLYRALALVPGIENDGTVKDAAGRAAVAIAWNQEPYAPEFTRRIQILFATGDAAYLGSRVSDQAIVRGSKIIGETAHLQAEIVNDVGER